MKVIVFGRWDPPVEVKRVATEQIDSEEELKWAMRRLSGGAFAVIILTSEDEIPALLAAQIAKPPARVILARGHNLQEVTAPGVYRACILPY